MEAMASVCPLQCEPTKQDPPRQTNMALVIIRSADGGSPDEERNAPRAVINWSGH